MASQRGELGDEFNYWYHQAGYPEIDHVDVRQSSDSEFHCLSLIVWFWRDAQ
ncbi:MAG: hypothetical protein KJO40_19515 [Deltaproteobacteria bacterium]|nr:hypothetical protein [Deltaproteobacteria bacterium]